MEGHKHKHQTNKLKPSETYPVWDRCWLVTTKASPNCLQWGMCEHKHKGGPWTQHHTTDN